MKKIILSLILSFFLLACQPPSREAKSYPFPLKEKNFTFEEATLYTYTDDVEKILLHKLSPEEVQSLATLFKNLDQVDPGYGYASVPDKNSLMVELKSQEETGELFLYDDKPDPGDKAYYYTLYLNDKTHVLRSKKDLMDPIRKLTRTEIKSSFPDCQGHWANKFIAQVEEKDLMKGKEDGNFYPQENLSRYDLVLSLYNHSRFVGQGEESGPSGDFKDVKNNSPYADAIYWAKYHGLVSGRGDGYFHGDDPTSRQEIALILYKYTDLLGNLHQDKKGPLYKDHKSIAPWAQKAVYTMQMEGYMTGKEGNFFDPQAPISRGEWARILASL